MLAKSWKKILFVILIIACLWNIISKIAHAMTFNKVVDSYKTEQEQSNSTNIIRENKI